MSNGVLAAAYAFHLAATAAWFGGLIFLAVFLPGPAAHLPQSERDSSTASAVRRFLPIAWLCLAVFVGTGLVQMAASPRYEGLLALRSAWAAALLAKHLVIGCMVVVLAFQTWYIHPRLERLELGLERPNPESVARLHRLDVRLLRLSVVLSAVVLVLTAVARANA